MHDILITGGTVIDGSGRPPYAADVAIRDGLIVAIGQNLGQAKREISAAGSYVTPGFIDIHTHYDGQVEWDSRLSPSPNHGVTSVVMSNCGVGFAPVRPADKDRLIRLMEGVEDIPHPVLADGLSWNWETLPQYLDQIDSKPHAIDFAVQLPHGPLRVYVMGERGANREAATPADLAEMQRIVIEAMEAGAIGFSTSRTILHKSSDGDPSPSYGAANQELLALADAMGQTGKGVFEMVSDFADIEAEFGLFSEMVERSGRPLSFSLAQSPVAPEGYKILLQKLADANAQGLAIKGQVIGRPVGILFGLDCSAHPFFANPGYVEIAHLPLVERAAEMRKPERRARILAHVGQDDPEILKRYPPYIAQVCGEPGLLYQLGSPPNYLPKAETRCDRVAQAQGRTIWDVVYDWVIARDGSELLYLTLTNYAHENDTAIHELISHPHTLMGLSDGGAHYGMICDVSAPTYMLTYWAKHPDPAKRVPIEQVVNWLTDKPAQAIGLLDRGRLAPGYRADLNLIDFDKLHLHAPHMVQDLPSGGRRLLQLADGYRATLVKGEVILENGHYTGALPGRLIRGAQKAPQPA